MYDGDRSNKSKTRLIQAGIAATLLVVIFTGLGVWWQSGYHQNAGNKAAQYERWSKNEIRTGCVSFGSLPKAECTYKAKQAAQENKRAEYDLYAQRTSALWAGIMAVAALVGIGLSGVGVYLVYTTFEATKQANYYTKLQMVPRFNIRDFSVSVSNPFHRVQTRPSITFSGPTAPDLIRVTAITRLYGEVGSILYEWSDSRWQKADEWFDIIPFTTEILLAGEFRDVTQDVIAAVSADAQITVSFVDVFGDSHSSTQKFKGARSGQAVGIDLSRVLHE
jgi:hypothetical protein